MDSFDKFQETQLPSKKAFFNDLTNKDISDENYRKVIHDNYGLDPVHFFTAPALSWSAGLKFTKAKLEIPFDVDMHIFFDLGLTGGISMVAEHFARANNKYMKELFDPETLHQEV